MSGDTLHIQGMTRDELRRLSTVLGIEPVSDPTAGKAIRDADSLLSAAFLLGVINATPHIMSALRDVMSDIRKRRLYAFKLTSHDGASVIEGSATPERIAHLSRLLEQRSSRDK